MGLPATESWEGPDSRSMQVVQVSLVSEVLKKLALVVCDYSKPRFRGTMWHCEIPWVCLVTTF